MQAEEKKAPPNDETKESTNEGWGDLQTTPSFTLNYTWTVMVFSVLFLDG